MTAVQGSARASGASPAADRRSSSFRGRTRAEVRAGPRLQFVEVLQQGHGHGQGLLLPSSGTWASPNQTRERSVAGGHGPRPQRERERRSVQSPDRRPLIGRGAQSRSIWRCDLAPNASETTGHANSGHWPFGYLCSIWRNHSWFSSPGCALARSGTSLSRLLKEARPMLLCLSMARMMFSYSICGSSGNGVLGCCVRTRQGGATPGGGQALIRSRGQRVMVWTGGGRQIVRRPARVRQPIRGSGRPRSSVGCQSATWRRWG